MPQSEHLFARKNTLSLRSVPSSSSATTSSSLSPEEKEKQLAARRARISAAVAAATGGNGHSLGLNMAGKSRSTDLDSADEAFADYSAGLGEGYEAARKRESKQPWQGKEQPWQGQKSSQDKKYPQDKKYSPKRGGAKSAAVEQQAAPQSEHHGSRHVTDVRTIYQGAVPFARMIPLPVVSITDKGAFVDAQEHGELFVPNSQLPEGLQEGDMLRVFIYQQSSRSVATAKHPYFELGQTGLLKVTAINHQTVYLDLGLPKELVLPISEQRRKLKVGDWALVLIALDEQGRMFATQCFNRYIRDRAYKDEFTFNQKVKLVAVATTPLGLRVIVDDKVYGLIYNSELSQQQQLRLGKRYDGYIQRVRPDGHLDVSLQSSGREGISQAAFEILQALHLNAGHLDFNDKTSPEEIESTLHMSKSRFKKAIGSLYKERLITIGEQGIDLTEHGREYMLEQGAPLTSGAGATEAKAVASGNSLGKQAAASFEAANAAEE